MTTIDATRAEAPLILTLDIGTSSTRALLYDARGRAVEGMSARERSTQQVTSDGTAEEDADAAFHRIERCIDDLLLHAGPLADAIGAVAIDTFVSNIMAVDAAGKPLTPLIIYADTRNGADAVELQQRLDERRIHERTGCLLRTSYWPARLAWFRREYPEIWRDAARWITIGEYLEQRLFGRSRVSYSAAAWSGLLDRRQLIWDTPLLDALRLDASRLSPLVDIDAPQQGLTGTAAVRWPALRDIPWFPAIGDGAAANIGSGCIGPDRVAITVGTTGALRVVRPHVARVPHGLWCYRVDRRRALLGGATSEGGNVYSWLRRLLYLSGGPDVTERSLAAMPPDSHGLTILPFLAGERSPGWAGDVSGVVAGLTLGTGQIDLLRAGLESIAYRFALIAEQIFAAEEQPTQLIASGGALLSSPTWMQIIADTLGRPVTVSSEGEATSRGCALLALEALGVIDTLARLPAAVGETYEPDTDRHACYRSALERQRRLYDMLIGQGWR
ncbi:MAG TPA: gluconokinase [Roseiflexaceae bacterium]|nr:gluconokinase [Roseiflexaceae bacterium]